VPATTAAKTPSVVSSADSAEIQKWCTELNARIQKKYRWPENPCAVTHWSLGGHSTQGRPLVYAEFGKPDSDNTTLVLSMVHGDEATPLFLGLRLAKWVEDNQDVFTNDRIVIVPLVNPDGFFRDPQTRMNANGVDINRNFHTKDWETRALQDWKKKFHSDRRRNPGPSPESEIETRFQIEMINKFHPSKIVSVHAPLNFLDYDGPNTLTLQNFPKDYVERCLQLRAKVRAITSRFFPGSLGNYAGQERGIPTFTLELPTADYRKALGYWRRFKTGIRTVIDYRIPAPVSSRESGATGG
jgi:protein MpaA